MRRDSSISFDLNDLSINKVKSETKFKLSLRDQIPISIRSPTKKGIDKENNMELNNSVVLQIKQNKSIQNCSRISVKPKLSSDNINMSSDSVGGNKFQLTEYPQSPTKNKIPRRLIAAISLLVNVKGFYRKVTRNSRIFEKLSMKQFNQIGDYSAVFQIKQKLWGNSPFVKQTLSRIIQFYKFICSQIPEIPKLSPFSLKKKIWDLLQAFLILSTCFLLSLFYFFRLDLNDFNSYLKSSFYLFIMDIFVSLNTGILEDEGNLVYNSKSIIKKYLKQTFIFDLAGIIPLSYFASDSSNYNDNKYIWIIFAIFFLKIRNFRIITQRLYFYLGFQKNLKPFVEFIGLIFLIVCVCHTFSLFWHGLAIYEIEIGREDTWLHAKELVNDNVWKKYIYSFYYLAVTMITVGYGDVTPQNPIELSFTIVTMFITAVFWALFMNTIGIIIENIEQQDKLYNKNMEIIHRLMREEQINPDLRFKISRYLNYLYKEFNEVQKDEEQKIINKLSKKLKEDLILNIQGKYLKDIPIIDKLKQKKEITQIMEECIFSPGEYVFKQFDKDDCSIYYIVKGQVDILFSPENRNETILQSIQRKQYFGEISFILGNPRSFSAKAKTFCRLYRIPREQFIHLIKQNEYDFENFQMIKDAVFLKNNFKLCNISCSTCQSGNHLSQNCPKTHLTLPKQILIYRLNATQSHFERVIQKRKSFRYRSLINQYSCFQAIYDINDNEDLHYFLDELETLGNFAQNDCISEEDFEIDEQGEEDYEEQKFNKKRTSFISRQTLMSKQSHAESNDYNHTSDDIQKLSYSEGQQSRQYGPIKCYNQPRMSLSSIREKPEKNEMNGYEEKSYRSSKTSFLKQVSPQEMETSIQKNFKPEKDCNSHLTRSQNVGSMQLQNQTKMRHNDYLKKTSIQSNYNMQMELSQVVDPDQQKEESTIKTHALKNSSNEKQVQFEQYSPHENDYEHNKTQYLDSLSSITSKFLLPSRMLNNNNDKKNNSFTSFKEGSQFSLKKQSNFDNPKSQTRMPTMRTHRDSNASPQNSIELQKRLTQFQQVQESDFPVSPFYRQSSQLQPYSSSQQQQQQQQYQQLSFSQQNILSANNSPYYSLKYNKQTPRQNLQNKQQIKGLNQYQIHQQQAENLASSKNIGSQLHQSFQSLMVQQLGESPLTKQISKHYNSQQLIPSPINNNLLKNVDANQLRGGDQQNNQLIIKDFQQEEQQAEFIYKDNVNYFILQNFELAKIFMFYNPKDNYNQIIKKYSQLLEKKIGAYQKRKISKQRKKSRFISPFMK